MALSNLIWWPWAQLGTEAPPTPGDEPWRRGGDRRLHHEVIRKQPPSEDEMFLISVILSES